MEKNIFISYRATGEDKNELNKIMKKVYLGLEKKGYNLYCILWDLELQTKGKKELFKSTMKKIDNSKILFVFSKSEEKSEGMLMEIGYAMAKGKKIVLLIKKDVKKTHLRELIEQTYEFENLKDLDKVIEGIEI